MQWPLYFGHSYRPIAQQLLTHIILPISVTVLTVLLYKRVLWIHVTILYIVLCLFCSLLQHACIYTDLDCFNTNIICYCMYNTSYTCVLLSKINAKNLPYLNFVLQKWHQPQLTRLHRQVQEAQARRRQWSKQIDTVHSAISLLRRKLTNYKSNVWLTVESMLVLIKL